MAPPVAAPVPVREPVATKPMVGFDAKTSVEDVSGRGAKIKTFVNADGSHTAELATEPLNYRTADGQWAAVDNHLVVAKDGTITNAANDWSVSFGSSGSGIGVETADGATFGWRPRVPIDVAPKVEPDGESVRYVDAWPGVDLVYRVTGGAITEFIELKDASAATSFDFDIAGASLSGDSTQGWSAAGPLASTGVQVSAPRSFDSRAMSVDDKVSASMTRPVASPDTPVDAVAGKAANVAQTMSVVVDSKWLASLSADQFPVVVDPTWYFGTGTSSVAYKANGTVSPGPMTIGNPVLTQTSTAWWRSVVAFDISGIYGADVYHAHLRVGAQPVGTGLQSIYGYVAAFWGWQNPTGSPVIWDAIDADNPNQQELQQSDALTALYDGWAGSSVFGGLLLLGTETAGFYSLVQAPVELWLEYDSPPTSATSGLISPADGASSHNMTQTYKANVASDPDGEALSYEFYYCTSQSCSAGQNSMGVTSDPASGVTYTIPAVFNSQTYYWGVRATDPYPYLHVVDMPATSRRSISFSNVKPVATLVSPPPNTLAVPGAALLLKATVTDPDGDLVNYRFTVTPAGGTGLLVSTPWQGVASGTTVQYQLPNGLSSSLGYTWTVETKDNFGAVGDNVSSNIKMQSRLGTSSVAPMQSVGPLSVNLATGNVVVSAGTGKAMATVGGTVGATFTYNSQDRSNLGLRATYYTDNVIANGQPDAGEIKLSRVDPLPSFQWSAGSPAESVPADIFAVRWSGFMRVPLISAGTHSWQFAGSHDDTMKITITRLDNSAPQVVYNSTSTVLLDTPTPFTGATPITLNNGELVKIQVDYSEATGSAYIGFRAAADGAERAVNQDWFGVNAPDLPTGWTFSADNGLDARWVSAKLNEDNVTLTGADGELVSFARQAGNGTALASKVAWVGPPDEDDIVDVDATTGEVTVHSADGYDYVFDNNGRLKSVSTPEDDLKPAGAETISSPGTVTTNPVKVTELRDRLDSTNAKSIKFRYSQSGLGPCPVAVTGFDNPAPDGMLCQVEYPDGTTTRLYYQAGLLARISDPGDESPNPAPEGRAVTDLRWTSGQLTQIWTPADNDRITSQGTGTSIPVGQQIIAEDLDTEIVWSPTDPEPTTVTLPRPIAGQPRPQTTFNIGASSSTVSVAGIAGTARTVTFDPAGRTLTDADAVNRTTTTQWAPDADIVLSTTSGGRKSTTIFDSETRAGWHQIDNYGPAPTACFGADRKPVANPSGTPGCGIVQVPHTHSDYDHNLKGLQGKYWSNNGQDGQPKGHGMGPSPSGNGNVDYSWPDATLPPGLTAPNSWSARFTGLVYPPTTGNYVFTLTSGTTDSATLYVNEVAQIKTSSTLNSDFTGSIGFTGGQPLRIRIDLQAGTGTTILRLSLTPSGGSPDFLGTISKPGFFYATKTTVDDNGTGVPSSAVTESRFDEGLDPVYGIATSSTVDPTGLALKTLSAFETPGSGSLLRRTRRTLPAFASAPTTSNSTTYSYYAITDTAANPCVAGSLAVPQAGLQKQTITATPATGTAITTETVYDILGRPVASRYLPDTAWTCTTYDARGRVIQVKFPADTTYPSGRTVTSTYRVGTGLGDPFTTTVADNSVTGSPNGSTITNVVDALGRPVSYTDVWNNTTTTSYDQAGRVTATTAPNGSFTYTYDTVGRLTHEYLAGVEIATPSYTSDSATLDPGALDYITYPAGAGNGTKGVVTRDPLGRTKGLTWTKLSNSALITSDTVTRSTTGRVLDDTIDGAGTAAWTYTYDAAGRLTNAVGSGHNYVYGYATSGGCGVNTAAGKNTNRSTLVDNSVTVASYCYDNADRLTSTTQTGYTGTIGYDAHGNTTQIAGQTLAYDYANRHLATFVPNATSPTSSVVYQRDSTDRIVARTATGPASTTRNGYCGGGDAPCVTMDATGTIIEQTISLPGGVGLTIRPGANPPTTIATKNFDTTTNGMVNWYSTTVATTTAQKRTGAASLQVTASAAAWGIIDGTSPAQAVTAGTSYTFSIWAKAATTGAPVIPVMSWRNSTGGSIVDVYAHPGTSDTTTGWTEIKVTGIAPPGAVAVKYGITINTSAVGQVHYFDDYTLTTSAVNVATVASKGFETTSDGMTVLVGTTATPTTAQAHSGTRSLAITPTAGWSVTEATGTTISPTSTYQLTGWEKLSTGTPSLQVGVIWSDSGGNVLRTDNIVNAPGTTTGWTAFTTQHMTPPAGAATAKVKLYGGTLTGTTWYIDDITLSTVTPAATTTNIWSYPNIHGDTQATADASGVRQGSTFTYDPYGNPLNGIVDNQTGEIDNAWLGQHQRPLEHQTGTAALIEMGARGYNPTLGRFLEVDPIEGGTTTNDYAYVRDPIGDLDLSGEGLFGISCGVCGDVWDATGGKAVSAINRHVVHPVSSGARAAGRWAYKKRHTLINIAIGAAGAACAASVACGAVALVGIAAGGAVAHIGVDQFAARGDPNRWSVGQAAWNSTVSTAFGWMCGNLSGRGCGLGAVLPKSGYVGAKAVTAATGLVGWFFKLFGG